MPPSLLAFVFLLVMGGAVGLFWAAFLHRKRLRLHKRLGIAGVAVDLLGTVAVVVTARVFGWHVPPYDERVAAVHRGFAYAATALVLLVAVTGARRDPLHTRLWPAFLPVYTATYALAVWAYAPR